MGATITTSRGAFVLRSRNRRAKSATFAEACRFCVVACWSLSPCCAARPRHASRSPVVCCSCLSSSAAWSRDTRRWSLVCWCASWSPLCSCLRASHRSSAASSLCRHSPDGSGAASPSSSSTPAPSCSSPASGSSAGTAAAPLGRCPGDRTSARCHSSNFFLHLFSARSSALLRSARIHSATWSSAGWSDLRIATFLRLSTFSVPDPWVSYNASRSLAFRLPFSMPPPAGLFPRGPPPETPRVALRWVPCGL
mmetsp:Transcript_82092/g.244875  ORF Transcript_82092/g.244875 Transcript_82092/m.244875 type:complete len:252 (+) Transcript_82092:689-1444(+)